MRHHAFAAILAVSLGASCGASCVSGATEIVVYGDTNVVDVPIELRSWVTRGASVAFDDAEPTHAWSVRSGSGDDAGASLPSSFAIVPAAGESNVDEITLLLEGTAHTPDGDVVLRRVIRTAFVPHTSQIFRVFLNGVCSAPAATPCASGACTQQEYCESQSQTCGDLGACVSIQAVATDAGFPDAGRFDARRFDAGTLDATLPDNGPPPCDGGTHTCGVGACMRTMPSCRNGRPVVCMPGASAPETCNGIDDDCDGVVDNGVAPQNCYPGAGATRNVGACRDGTQSCTGGAFGACTGATLPRAETCNGIDDDCNGQVDDGIAARGCYTGAAGTSGVGPCHGGMQSCTGGSWGACNGEVTPAAESCNLVDDNCNGSCDDGVAGCRVPVYRWLNAGVHYYSNDTNSPGAGWTLESGGSPHFYLYAGAQPGLQPFYRCRGTARAAYLETTAANCEAWPSVNQGMLGYIATSATCGSRPLYRLFKMSTFDHFLTIDGSEATATMSFGYVQEVIYQVW